MGNWGRVNIGSGGGKLFAIIAVTYPAGSVCTCTNGARTLKAKDTSGKVLFNVPSAGTWVVSCTNGTKTASKSVSITAERQAETVNLKELELYNAGVKNVEFSTGTAGNSAGTVTWNDAAVKLYAKAVTNINHMGVTYIYTTEAQNLTEYSALKAVLGIAEGTGYHFALNITSGIPTFTAGNPVPTNMIARSAYDSPTTGMTAELDIEEINSGYICVEVWTTNAAGTNVTANVNSIILGV